MKRLSAVLLVVAIFGMVSSAVGHTPVAGAVRRYPPPDYKSLPYKFDANVPTWLRSAANAALPTGWVVNNNSRSPRFSYSATGAGTVHWSTTSIPACDVQVPNWVGCAGNGGLSNWHIWIRSNATAPWCEVTSGNGCRMVKRTVLHEAVHVTLTSSHDNQAGTLTLMGPCTPNCLMPNPGYDATTWLECDQAGFQMKYGMQYVTGQYADCLDHISGAVPGGGLATPQTLSTTVGDACRGDSIPVSGRIATMSNTNYGLLSNIALATRLLQIDRKLHSSSNWTPNWASVTTTTAQTGYNWTRSFTESPVLSTAYDYKVHFLGQSGLAPSYSAVITLTFLNPCPPPP